MLNIDAIETIEVVDSPVINYSKSYIDFLCDLAIRMNEEAIKQPLYKDDDDDFEWPF